MSEQKLTDSQVDALLDYVEARTRRYAYAKHASLVVCLAVASYFVMRLLIDSPGKLVVPQWLPAVLAGAGIVIAIIGAGLFTWAVAVTRGNLRSVGLSAELISNFDKYPVRELSKRFSDRS